MIAGLAALAIVLLVLHAIGSTLARLVGTVLIFFSLIWLSTGSEHVTAPGWYLLSGIGFWVFGHWLWAFKHKTWRTALARRVFTLPVLHTLAPIESRQRREPVADWPASNWGY